MSGRPARPLACVFAALAGGRQGPRRGLITFFAGLQGRKRGARAQAPRGLVTACPYVGARWAGQGQMWGKARSPRDFCRKIIFGVAAGNLFGIFRRVAAAAGLLGPAAKPEGRREPQRIL